jgi:hypothetical protein
MGWLQLLSQLHCHSQAVHRLLLLLLRRRRGGTVLLHLLSHLLASKHTLLVWLP